MNLADLMKPATEAEIGDVMIALSASPGLHDVVRRLAFQRDELRAKLSGESQRVAQLREALGKMTATSWPVCYRPPTECATAGPEYAARREGWIAAMTAVAIDVRKVLASVGSAAPLPEIPT